MKSIRNHGQFLGIIVLTLVCLSFAAAPASAGIGHGGPDHAAYGDVGSESRVSLVSTIQDGFAAFWQRLGGIFAGQSGSSILD